MSPTLGQCVFVFTQYSLVFWRGPKCLATHFQNDIGKVNQITIDVGNKKSTETVEKSTFLEEEEEAEKEEKETKEKEKTKCLYKHGLQIMKVNRSSRIHQIYHISNTYDASPINSIPCYLCSSFRWSQSLDGVACKEIYYITYMILSKKSWCYIQHSAQNSTKKQKNSKT